MAAPRRATGTGPPASQEESPSPFKDFLGPGRRRTDHPLVIGIIVICLAVTALMSIFGLAALISHNGQLQRVVELNQMQRLQIVRAFEEQTHALRRVCINVAKTLQEVKECQALRSPDPPAPPAAIRGGHGK